MAALLEADLPLTLAAMARGLEHLGQRQTSTERADLEEVASADAVAIGLSTPAA